MNIGEAAQSVGLPTKTVRYYADVKLVEPEGRSTSGYRLYGPKEVNKLLFVKRARNFGFSVEECRELLSLYEDSNRSSRDVKAIAQERIVQIEQKMKELKSLHDELRHLADTCHGDERPDCPILNRFAEAKS